MDCLHAAEQETCSNYTHRPFSGPTWQTSCKKKLKASHTRSLPSVGPGADPGVQAVSPQVTISHPPGGRLPLFSARPAVTFPSAEHHRPLTGTTLYCLVTEAYRCEQLAKGCYAALPRVWFEPTTCWSQVQHSTRCATAPPMMYCCVKNLTSEATTGIWLIDWNFHL